MEFQIAFNFLLTNINLIQRNDLTKTKITANQNKREIAQEARSNDPLFTARKTVSTTKSLKIWILRV